MKFSSVRIGLLSAAVLSAVGAGLVRPAWSGCPCQKGSRGAVIGAPLSAPVAVSPLPTSPVGLSAGPVPQEAIQPPPGTLGRTYQMKSLPVPVSMHPRVGMLDVRIPNAAEVLVHDVANNRTEDALVGFQDAVDPTMWHFQSEPLIPGLPHIYRIEARFNGPNGPRMEERYVRLIRGRLIEVEF